MKNLIVMVLLLCVIITYTYAWNEYYEKNITPIYSAENIVEIEVEPYPNIEWKWQVEIDLNQNGYNKKKVLYFYESGLSEEWIATEEFASEVISDLIERDMGIYVSEERINEIITLKNRENQKTYAEEEMKNDDNKSYNSKKVKEQTIKNKQKVIKAAISASMKNRIDTVIENFVEKLEDRWYSDAQMTSAIDTVISRLWEFKNKAGYREIVAYMLVVLEEYRNEYSNPLEDLETIFFVNYGFFI